MTIFRVLTYTFKMRPVLFLGVFLFSTLLAVSCLFQTKMKSEMMSLSKVQEKQVYFYTLLKKESKTSWIKTKVESLPGVIQVGHMDSDTLMSKVLNKIPRLDGRLGEMVHGYEALRISLKAGLGQKSYEMVQAYIQRLAGEGSASIGGLKGDTSHHPSSELQVIDYIVNAIYLVLFAAFSILSYLLMKQSIEVSKTFCRYQRDSYLQKKVLLSTVFLLILPLLVSLFYNPSALFFILLCLPLTVSIPFLFQKRV